MSNAMIEPCEAERQRSVSVLALGPRTARLQQGGFAVLGDVLADASCDYQGLRRLPALGRQSIRQVQERVGAVLSCTDAEGRVDWTAFRRLCGLERAEPDTPLQPWLEPDRARPVSQLRLGPRTPRLVAGGLTTAGCLIDDRDRGFQRVRQAPRLGDAAVVLVERRLAILDQCRQPDGAADWDMFTAICTGQPVVPPVAPEPPEPAPPENPLSGPAMARPVEVLRLGTKAKFLRQAGLSTLGHLVRNDVSERVRRLSGIGPNTAELIQIRLADLRASTDDAGEPAWDTVAAGWGFPVTPDRPLPTGQAFLEATAEVVDRWISAHTEAADRLILRERLVRDRDGRQKLESLGRQLGMTREGVRRREQKLLEGLCEALLSDDQSASPVQFTSDYRRWWERAGSVLSDVSDLSWPAFVSGLERAWGVPASRLTEILPLALAVLTEGGQVVTPRTPVPRRLLEPLPPELLRLPVRSFPIGRALKDLEACDCSAFGGLLLAAMENRLPQGRSGVVGGQLLSAVGEALDAAGRIDPARLAVALEVPLLPDRSVDTPSDFLAIFDVVMEAAADYGRTSARAAAVWRIRTSRPAAGRPTLAETADRLGAHGPEIKREETVLLASLNAQLIDSDLSRAGVLWRQDFLDRVAEASIVRQEVSGDHDRFIGRLAEVWGIEADVLRLRTAGLWAVLSLYPHGRRRHRPAWSAAPVPPPPAAPEPTAGGAIILRGFRRHH